VILDRMRNHTDNDDIIIRENGKMRVRVYMYYDADNARVVYISLISNVDKVYTRFFKIKTSSIIEIERWEYTSGLTLGLIRKSGLQGYKEREDVIVRNDENTTFYGITVRLINDT